VGGKLDGRRRNGGGPVDKSDGSKACGEPLERDKEKQVKSGQVGGLGCGVMAQKGNGGWRLSKQQGCKGGPRVESK